MKKLIILSVLILGILAYCNSYAMAEEWEIMAGCGPTYGSTFSPSKKDSVGFQAYFDVGLNESVSLDLGGGLAAHQIGSGQAGILANVGFGVVYHLDVLVVVPFLSLRLGWLQWDPEDDSATSGLGISLALGFDYLWTENFTVGFAAEYHGLLDDLETFPVYVAFTGRVGFRLLD